MDPKLSFEEITLHVRPCLLLVSGAQAILLLGNVALLLNLYTTVCEILNLSKPAVFNTPTAVETHAS